MAALAAPRCSDKPVNGVESGDRGQRGPIVSTASGTEPKIKYYLFAQERPKQGKFAPSELEKIKSETSARLERLWLWLQKDADTRWRDKLLDSRQIAEKN